MLKFAGGAHHIDLQLAVRSPSYNVEANKVIMENCRDMKYITNLLHESVRICETLKIDTQENALAAEKTNMVRIHEELRSHPWGLFNECVAKGCLLNRLQMPVLRYHFDTQFTGVMLKEREQRDTTLHIGVYFSMMLFHPLALAARLLRLGYKKIHLHAVFERSQEIITLMQDSQHNPQAASYLFDPEQYQDEHENRGPWLYIMAWRFIKALEFSDQIELSIYDSFATCRELDRKMDVFIGMDFIDEFYGHKFIFWENALQITKPDGIIYAVHTNGLCASQPMISAHIVRNRGLSAPEFATIEQNVLQAYEKRNKWEETNEKEDEGIPGLFRLDMSDPEYKKIEEEVQAAEKKYHEFIMAAMGRCPALLAHEASLLRTIWHIAGQGMWEMGKGWWNRATSFFG